MNWPESFTIFGHTFEVVLKKNLIKKHGVYGRCKYDNLLIEIQHPDYTEIHESVLQQTFFHELTHAIFFVLGEDDLNNNEKLVDLIGMCLHQVNASIE